MMKVQRTLDFLTDNDCPRSLRTMIIQVSLTNVTDVIGNVTYVTISDCPWSRSLRVMCRFNESINHRSITQWKRAHEDHKDSNGY